MLETELGLQLHPEKTRIVHITRALSSWATRSGAGVGCGTRLEIPACTIPTDRSTARFKDKVRTATNRRKPKDLEGVLDERIAQPRVCYRAPDLSCSLRGPASF